MNYVQKLRDATASIREDTKEGLAREERFERIDVATIEYALVHSERRILDRIRAEKRGAEPPIRYYDVQLLGELSDLCLYEELTDTDRMKVRDTEYPFLSDIQLARRKDGVHQRKNEGGQGEVSFKQAFAVGTDGANYAIPRRRERSNIENDYINKHTQSRNKARRERYNEFIKPGKVVTYYADSRRASAE